MIKAGTTENHNCFVLFLLAILWTKEKKKNSTNMLATAGQYQKASHFAYYMPRRRTSPEKAALVSAHQPGTPCTSTHPFPPFAWHLIHYMTYTCGTVSGLLQHSSLLYTTASTYQGCLYIRGSLSKDKKSQQDSGQKTQKRLTDKKLYK